MLQEKISIRNPLEWLGQRGQSSEGPVQFFAPALLSARHRAFRDGFPGEVTFAVKANPAAFVLSQLAVEGMTGFDVASPDEIALVAGLCPGALLHYHNPVRSRAEIAAGIAANVTSWAVDDMGEWHKLLAAGLPARAEVAVRLALPVGGGAYHFGAKFGATPAEAEALLRAVAAAGRVTSMTFHVGTQCTDPGAWAIYMAQVARIAQAAGVQLHRLNVGGGFPAGRDGQMVDLAPYFAVIRAGLEAFAHRPALVCEPGRGMVADAFSYGARVKSLRGDRVYLCDGIYAGLAEFNSMPLPAFAVHDATGARRDGEERACVIYGPTCDSLDRLPGAVALPASITEGDWIIFRSMGAYLYGMTTRFNGYGAWETVRVADL